MCFNNFLNIYAKTLNDSYFQTDGVFLKHIWQKRGLETQETCTK